MPRPAAARAGAPAKVARRALCARVYLYALPSPTTGSRRLLALTAHLRPNPRPHSHSALRDEAAPTGVAQAALAQGHPVVSE